MRYVRIPEARIGVLVGPSGETRKEIEDRTGARLDVAEDGQVVIDETGVFEPLLGMKAQDIVKAIGRGFDPKKAYRILQDDVYFYLIDMREFTGRKTKQALHRLKSRIIGSDGKTRRTLEILTGADIAIYGHTIAIIGDLDEAESAKTGVEMILGGAKHSTVYKVLEAKRRDARFISYVGTGIEDKDPVVDEDDGSDMDEEDGNGKDTAEGPEPSNDIGPSEVNDD